MFGHPLGQTHDSLMQCNNESGSYIINVKNMHCFDCHKKILQIYPNTKNKNSKKIEKQTCPNCEIQYPRAKR